jgi:hypothetical protein
MSELKRIKKLCEDALNGEIPNNEALIRIHEITCECDIYE